ncbi:MAG TPA: hypothetical protein VFG39_08900 [Balneolaceae bacterium]|nr:hypothetical protein [Balneolaceae bacterium]
MPQLPFDIPKSLNSYAQHFEDDPAKATKRLKKQLKKRGHDAVGHFLLAWFYHLRDMNEEAVDEALIAKIYAPGSPFFQKLHYYLSHPHIFQAWVPKSSGSAVKKSRHHKEPGPVLKNLDSLISRLSKVESKGIRMPLPEKEIPEKELSDNVDDIVSETLALIHEKQGKIEDAIRTYQQLKKLNREKKDFYNKQILRLQEERKQQEAEG